MKMRQLWVGIGLLAVLCLTMGVTHAQEKSYSADRFDVAVTVEEGGSVLVTETVVFDFVGGPFTFVFRELPLDHTDGISVIEASVDGVTYPVGANAGQVEISTGNPMRITWHLEPTSNATRTFVLTYRAAGVVRQESGTDALYWQPLPDSYEYSIGESESVVTYPAGTELVAEPEVLAGTAVINQSANQATFSVQNLQPNSPLVFMMQFAEGSLITAPPNWQVEQAAAAQRRAALNAQIPYWIALAFFVFGFGFAVMFVYARRHTAPSTKTKMTVMEPPGKLPAGMAGALASHNPSPAWTHAQGTMFSLAEQGVIVIEELPEKTWYRKHDFTVKQIDQAAGLKPHEKGFLDMLFGDKSEYVTSIKLSDMGKKITGSAWKQYSESLSEEIEQAGYLSKARKKARTTLYAAGVVLLLSGMAGFIAVALAADSFVGPMLIMGALFFLGIAGMIFAGATSPLSDAGAETAVSWQEFKNYLQAVSKGKQAVASPTMFEKYLPYAAAFGLLQQWTKHFEKEGWTETPAYFHALPNTTANHAMGAFVAMSAATHSSGGSAAGAGAGAAGAGAAGGGASGAG